MASIKLEYPCCDGQCDFKTKHGLAPSSEHEPALETQMLAKLKGKLNVNKGKALITCLPMNASALAPVTAQQSSVDCTNAEKTQ